MEKSSSSRRVLESKRRGRLGASTRSRIAKFAVASAIGFLVAEVILGLGVLFLFHETKVPGLDFSSPVLLGLDALALGAGVTVAFVINEEFAVNDLGGPGRARGGWLTRWGKYQLSSLLGNVLIVAVQLALLATTALSPIVGGIVGAVVTYPITYAISMRFVWRVNRA